VIVAAQILLAPLLVAVATLATRRWGAAVGGVLSAFPAIVGPVLLLLAHTRGPAFAAEAARGTLAGLVGLAAFVAVYGRACPRRPWPVCVGAGWVAAAGAAAVVAPLRPGVLAALVLAAGSLVAAYLALPRQRVAGRVAMPSLPQRMVLTAGLVVALAAAAPGVGALVGGMLAALPVLACVLAAGTHAEHGAEHAIALLRGMVAGMAGFVLFCVIVATAAASPASFAAATVTALAAQAVALRRRDAPDLARAA
jgi:hypothetical protein